MEALKDSFNEGNTCALGTHIHEAHVLKSTGPDHILCREEYDENSIVCSVSNLNVTFNVIHVVSFLHQRDTLKYISWERRRKWAMGNVSFNGLHVVAAFYPTSLVTEIRRVDYGAATEQPTHLLTGVFGSTLTENPRRQFFLGYLGSVFSQFT